MTMENLEQKLKEYNSTVEALPGASGRIQLQTFVRRLEESSRRNRFFELISSRSGTDPMKVGPSGFDPLKSAVWFRNSGQRDEACWLVFLSVLFGKHRTQGWALAREFYWGLGTPWTWGRTVKDSNDLTQWFSQYYNEIRARSGGGRFGNHRKYQSLRPEVKQNVPAIVHSYLDWVGEGHESRFAELALNAQVADACPFKHAYASMNVVVSFGRVARFDYLSTLHNLDIVHVEPTSPCLVGATGPLDGARLLFGNFSPAALETKVARLGNALGIGMDVLEDALCNWQKNPRKFTPFRG